MLILLHNCHSNRCTAPILREIVPEGKGGEEDGRVAGEYLREPNGALATKPQSMTRIAFNPREFPGYLFDLDGTLIDTAPDICAAVNHALGRFGFDAVSEDLVRHWVGHGGRACIEQAVASLLPDHDHAAIEGRASRPRGRAADASPRGGGRTSKFGLGAMPIALPPAALVDEMLTCFLEHYGAHIAEASLPYSGTRETLIALRDRGAKLAVVTNKRIKLTRRLLDELHLTTAFDAIVGGDTASNPKPAPDPIHCACQKIGLVAADILFVGDSATDVEAARAAGCPVVCVPHGYNHGIAPERLGADAVIGSLADLI